MIPSSGKRIFCCVHSVTGVGVGWRCGQEPGQQALSVLLQLWRRVDASASTCLEKLTWLGGCGEVKTGHSTTVVTLALMDWPVEKSKALFSGKFSPS